MKASSVAKSGAQTDLRFAEGKPYRRNRRISVRDNITVPSFFKGKEAGETGRKCAVQGSLGPNNYGFNASGLGSTIKLCRRITRRRVDSCRGWEAANAQRT